MRMKEAQLDGRVAQDWNIYPLEFKKDFLDRVIKSGVGQESRVKDGPCMCVFNLSITGKPRDTFLHTGEWTKGVVFVNGFNLGRYWKIGPQNTLYLPGPLLHEGDNEILIFELHTPAEKLTFADKADLGEQLLHKTALPAWAKSLIFILKQSLKMGDWVWTVFKPFLK